MDLTAVLSRALVVILFNADLRTAGKPHQAENVTDPHCVWAQAALAEEGSQPAGSLLPGQCPSAPPSRAQPEQEGFAPGGQVCPPRAMAGNRRASATG